MYSRLNIHDVDVTGQSHTNELILYDSGMLWTHQNIHPVFASCEEIQILLLNQIHNLIGILMLHFNPDDLVSGYVKLI